MAANSVAYYSPPAAQPADERERLILEHLPQVRWIANRIHDKLAGKVGLEDLISSGVIGLINAVDTFDPSYNVKLRTYAEHKIRGAILDSIRGLDGIPAHKRKALKKLETAIASVECRNQRAATEEEIAAELNIPVSEYQELLLELRAVTIGSIDEDPEGRSENALLSSISQDEDNLPNRLLETTELQRVLANGIEKMPKLERTILTLYYKEDQNLRDIAEVLDMHVTRVCQLKSQAVMRLRAYMLQKWPTTRGVYR
jgi:RNA polymerase sigma factor for flagellar operon FliA